MTKSTHETHTIKPHASPHARPGSAILIVVGTLALIAVFAAIYISIGQGDQRIADSIQKREEINANQDIFAEHILKVLGDDRLDYTAQRLDAANGIAYIRENTDAPYTDWTMRSETSVGEAWQRFNPSGRANSSVTQPSANDDFRVASDSWLAATSPTFLGDPGQPINGVDDLRPFGSVITEGSLDPSSFIANALSSGFLDKRDWLQISNLAPDGRFVNLFNLRQNQAFNDGTIGGFDAQTGFGTYTRLDGRTGRRMSEYLSLWNQESPGEPDSRIQTFDPSADGIWLPGRNLPETAHGITGDLANVPAVWTMYQRYMFMPLNQPFLTVNRNNLVSTWADPDFAAYQYADADGDGMADSRWIELVSAQEQAGGGSVRQGVERLYDAGRSRLFAGIRVVDLTSMVNVNTALDQLAQPEPSDQGVFGATPGDVDLRRFLSLSDPGQNYSVLQLAGLSPSSFHKPILTTNNDLLDVDYKWYRSYIDTTSPVGRKTIEPSSNTLSIGRYGYDALKRGLVNGDTLDSRYYAWPPELRALNSDPTPSMPGAGDFQDDFNPVDGDYDPNSNYRLNQFFAGATATEPLSARERRQWYLDYGRLNPIDVDPERSLAVPYGPEDLLEILAFHGLNDPSTVSRLEKSLMGRMPSIYEQNQRAFSPMLSNRPLALDRFRHGYVDQNNYGIAAPGDPREITGSIAKESMAFFSVTPRRLMTTVSGSAAILPGSVVTSTLPALTAVEAAPSLSGALSTPSSLFSVYSNALAGELNAGKVVGGSVSMLFEENIDDTRLLDTATLFYGHRGPELALRIAAHSAVNMTDLFDADQEPTAATLIIDDNLRNQLINDFSTTPIDSSDAEYGLYAGLAQGNLFDFGVSNLPDSVFTTSQAHRQAVNVFGIEPMPVLTEVSSMYVYMDSPMGDADFYDDGDPSTISIPRPPRPGLNLPVFPAGADGDPAIVEATIDGSVSETNEDLLMQVLAFQLTNPWDVSIQIGDAGGADQPMGYIDEDVNSPNNTNLNFDYYIEFGGRFFKLGQFVEFNPTDDRFGDPLDPDSPAPGSPITSVHEEYQYRSVTIAPNSSRVFYAIAHARFDAEEMAGDLDGKWTSLLGTSPDTDGDPSTGPAQEWVNEQFGVRAGDPATHIHQFDPRTGKLIEQGVFQDLLASPSAPADPVFENSDREHNFAQVRLWRKIRGTLEEVTTNAIPSQSIRDNLIQNDMLVDRISFSGGDLNRSLFAGNNPIEGSVSYDPAEYNQSQVNNVGVRNDNFGLTIARWATVRRGDNTEGAGALASAAGDQAGQISAWLLSSNRDSTFNTVVSTDPTYVPGDNTADRLLTIEDFLDGDLMSLGFPFPLANIRPGYEFHEEFNDLENLSSNREIIQTIVRKPSRKYLLDGLTPSPGGVDFPIRFPSEPLISNDAGQDLFATDSDLIPELLPNADGFNESPRLADLLLAWGIGPAYAPDPTRNANDVQFDSDENDRWMTLSEALAIGLGFQTAGITYDSTAQEVDTVWADTTSANESLFDNGHLSLKSFVPYFNNTLEAVGEVPVFNFDTDIRRGLGIPMALGVLDQARAIEPILDPTATNVDPLTQSTFGQININTAPVEVLRLLPGLSPSLTSYFQNMTDNVDEWWGENEAWNLPDLSEGINQSNTSARTPDVAAALVAYRDRLQAQPRFTSTSLDGFAQANPLRYTTANIEADQHALNMVREEFPFDPTATGFDEDHRDRGTIAGVNGLRTTPGFSSIGEVLMATIDEQAQGAGLTGIPVPMRTYNAQLDIQQFGYDDLNLDGAADDIVAMDPQLFSGQSNGSTVDDYAERLALANTIANSITVRSDYFAAWFVIHAYQEADVTNLQPEDPLVPSVAKRYVMVVDRTNVVNPGDTPKIVFIREVPM